MKNLLLITIYLHCCLLNLNAQKVIDFNKSNSCIKGQISLLEFENYLLNKGFEELDWKQIKELDNFGYSFYFNKKGQKIAKEYLLIRWNGQTRLTITFDPHINKAKSISWNDHLKYARSYYYDLEKNGYQEIENERIRMSGFESIVFDNYKNNTHAILSTKQVTNEVTVLIGKINNNQNTKDSDSRALFPGNKSGQTKGETESTNQGDQRDKTGNQGSGDGGPQINLSNWIWNKTKIQHPDIEEKGIIVFEIIVDENGEIISYRVLQSTVRRSLTDFYAVQVEDFTFTFNPPSHNSRPAPETKGTITLYISP